MEATLMDLDELRRLAGITPSKGYTPYQGSNISVTGNEKGELMKEKNIQPGTPEWFQLWFSLPKFMGGEPAIGHRPIASVGSGFRGRKK